MWYSGPCILDWCENADEKADAPDHCGRGSEEDTRFHSATVEMADSDDAACTRYQSGGTGHGEPAESAVHSLSGAASGGYYEDPVERFRTRCSCRRFFCFDRGTEGGMTAGAPA